MDKEDMIELLKLLAALQSWSFADKHRLPDYLGDRLTDAVMTLTEKILEEQK